MIVKETTGDQQDQDIATLVDNLEYIMKKIFSKTEIKEVELSKIGKCKKNEKNRFFN